ncbi:MAG: metallophosphoesterase [Phycisphaerales bacterium]|jgi:hypothetical protein|nr:metallophosphoesterase [Phycisphaerales bacterium]
MGLRFDLACANWVAHLIEPDSRVPKLDMEGAEGEAVRMFLRQLRDNFMSSPRVEYRFSRLIHDIDLDWELRHRRRPETVNMLRDFLGGRPWTALIVPSGTDESLDERLCSREFLRTLVEIRTEDPGLILQLDSPPSREVSLTDAFPAFRVAMARSAEWPGVLIWSGKDEAVFLPFNSHSIKDIERRCEWAFSHLAVTRGVDLEELENQYRREYPERSNRKRLVNLLHVSDLHIGCREASIRLPRVQGFLRTIVAELGEDTAVVPVLTGDLLDTPDEGLLNEARGFIEFLSNLGTHEPIIVPGNHDVRNNGYLAENFKVLFRLPTNQVQWMNEHRVGLLPFNSVMEGKLARGSIGEAQLGDMGSAIDRQKDWKDFALFAILHHHPMPVERPDWHARRWYEAFIGDQFEKTVALEDAAQFLCFAETRKVAAVLHGHKHIPRADELPTSRIPVYGCGSTVGKVPTKDGRPYMSVNVVTFDSDSRKVSTRLMAERMPGAGLEESKRHERVHLGR